MRMFTSCCIDRRSLKHQTCSRKLCWICCSRPSSAFFQISSLKNFNFDGPVVAGGVYGLTQPPQFDNAAPIMARPIRIPGRGTGQSETWKPAILPRARSICCITSGSHHTWNASMTTPADGLSSWSDNVVGLLQRDDDGAFGGIHRDAAVRRRE